MQQCMLLKFTRKKLIDINGLVQENVTALLMHWSYVFLWTFLPLKLFHDIIKINKWFETFMLSMKKSICQYLQTWHKMVNLSFINSVTHNQFLKFCLKTNNYEMHFFVTQNTSRSKLGRLCTYLVFKYSSNMPGTIIVPGILEEYLNIK